MGSGSHDKAVIGQHWMGNLAGAHVGYVVNKNKAKVRKERRKTEAANLRNEELEAELLARDDKEDDLNQQLEVEAATLSPEERAAAGSSRRTNPQVRESLLSQDAERRKRSLLTDRSLTA